MRSMLHLLLLTALVLSSLIPQAAIWTPPSVYLANIGYQTPNAVARWAAKNKVYYGFTTWIPGRECLLVFDTDANGNITSNVGRRYAVLPSTSTALNTSVWSIYINTRDSKLYLGLSSYDAGFTSDLSVFSLDANGEPTGSPTGYNSGNIYGYVTDMVLHPTLDRLYMVGYADNDVHYYNLTTAGVPTGSPGTITTGGGYGIASVDLNTAGTKIYCGSYPGVLESMTLDASGNKTGSTITKTTTGIDAYLDIAATNNNVCFRNPNTGNLNYWDLAAANGDPTGNLVTTTRKIQAKPARLDNANLLLVEPVTMTDAVYGTTGLVIGLKVCEYTVTTAGAVGTLTNNTANTIDTYDRVEANQVNGQTGPVIVANSIYDSANRFKNISVRYTLNSITVDGDIAPQYKLKDVSATADYLKFAYSSRWGKIYMMNPAANNIRTYNISADTFASNVAATTVDTDVAVDDNQTTYGRLYYARTNCSVDYRNLSSAGVPGTVVNNATGMATVDKIAVNTVQHKVYIVGSGGTAGQIGTTEMYKVPMSATVTDAVVCDRLHQLYIVTAYNGNSNVWVQNLTTAGVPTGTPTAYSDGFPSADGRTITGGVAVHPTLNKLYVSGYAENSSTYGYVAVLDLNASGVPTGTINLIQARGMYPYTQECALRGDGSYLYYTSSGDTGFFGVPLQSSDGLPAAGQKHYAWMCATGATPYHLEVASDNLKLFGGTYPWDLSVFEMQSTGQPKAAPSASLYCGTQQTDFAALTMGTATAWTSLNTGLTDAGGLKTVPLIMGSPDITAAQVKIEISTNNGTTVHKTSTVDTVNNTVSLMAPGYIAKASVTANVIGNVLTNTEQMAAYDAKITAPVDTPPTSFYVGDSSWYLDGTSTGIDNMMDIHQDMGINAVYPQNGAGVGSSYPADTVKSLANSNGITKFEAKNYELPTFFDYDTECFQGTYQADWWNNNIISYLKSLTNCSDSEIGAIVLADEPGWYYPERYDELESDNGHKDVFITYLKTINTTASWFGLASWNYADVHCGRYDDISTTAKRRLWYWTCRYFAQSYSNSCKASKDAVVAETNASVLSSPNLNNFTNRWQITHPGEVYNNNFNAGTAAASAAPDWYDLARKNAGTCLQTEDWCPDVWAQELSFRGALMRCAVRNATNGMKYGSYIVGGVTGDIPYGGQYKVLAMAGQGAKFFEHWCLGPTAVMPDDGASDSTWGSLQNIADGFDLLGQKQSVLYPGVPRTAGTVAVLLSDDSQPWDVGTAFRYSHHEVISLFAALSHAGYPVDIIDDRDIENGKLATYAYKTLYVTGANMSSTTATNIVNWVNAGGTCVVMPGAGRADQYNDALTTLYNQLGCTQGTVTRETSPITDWMSQPKTTININAAYQTPLGCVSADVYGQVAPLTVTTGTQMATMTGGSAIVLKTYGTGRFMTYGFWPGNQYWNAADRSYMNAMPINFDGNLRALISAPANASYGNATKYVASSTALVEGLVLENSTSGIGVVLLNWSGASIASNTVTLDKTMMPTAVKTALNNAVSGGTLVVNSAKKGNLSYTNTTNNISFTLTLDNVDVVTLTW